MLGVPLYLGEALLAAGEAHVLVGQRHVPGGVDEQAADQGQGVVSRGARAGPVGQFLAVRQDLLHHDPGAAGLGGQPGQVAARVGQPVGVVHPQPVDQPLVHQAQQHPVGGVEHVRVLDPDRDERVDVEEPPVVELGGRVVPVGEPVVLLRQQHAEGQVGHAVPEREHVVEVAKHRPAVGGGVLRIAGRGVDDEVAQALFQRPGQDGQQQLVLLRLPVDVEPVRELRLPALVEHRPQLPVERFRGGPGHVVGHHVDDHPQAVPVELGHHLAERGLPAEVRRDQRVVDDVVAVRRAGVGLQDRRQVDVRHAQRGQVAGLLGRLAEPEAVPELQPVGGHRVLAPGERAAGVPACGLSHGAATARSG